MRVGLSCAQFVIPLKGKCENEVVPVQKGLIQFSTFEIARGERVDRSLVLATIYQ